MASKFKPPLLYVRGFPYPGYSFYTKEKIESALDYQPRNDDLFIVTYPKSGTTWITYIVWEILHKGEKPPSMEDMNYKWVPYSEMCGAPCSNKSTEQGLNIFKYHTPYEIIPKNKNAKYIYIYRNPKDTLISRYFFTKEMMNCDLDLDDFFNLFFGGGLAHGLWQDHVLSWYKHRDDANVLFLSYEEMNADRTQSLLKIARFLGPAYETSLIRNENNLLENILEKTSFEYMKKNLPVAVPVSTDDGNKFRYINFFRKGVIGDWKNHLSEKQSEQINSMIEEKFRETILHSEFKKFF